MTPAYPRSSSTPPSCPIPYHVHCFSYGSSLCRSNPPPPASTSLFSRAFVTRRIEPQEFQNDVLRPTVQHQTQDKKKLGHPPTEGGTAKRDFTVSFYQRTQSDVHAKTLSPEMGGKTRLPWHGTQLHTTTTTPKLTVCRGSVLGLYTRRRLPPPESRTYPPRGTLGRGSSLSTGASRTRNSACTR